MAQASPEEQLQAAYQDALAEVGRFNLAIFGKTGAGKSTLINAIFGQEVAATGIGDPVTQGSHLYFHDSGTLGILDTQGVELGSAQAQVLADLRELVAYTRTQPVEQHVHIAWYCVRSTDARFEDFEESFIRELAQLQIPVLIVMTQVPKRGTAYSPDVLALQEAIRRRNLPLAHPEPLLTNALRDEFLGFPVHGLQDTLNVTYELAPVGIRNALVAAQQIDFDRKRRAARTRVKTAVGLSTAAGATPIPFSDAALLVPIQTAMMGSISVMYGVKLNTSVIAGLAATGLATQVGRSAAGSLFKMIPGAGSFIGGTINGSIAGAFTYGMGEAWIRVCERLMQGDFGPTDNLDTEALKSTFQQEFKEQATNWLKRKSQP